MSRQVDSCARECILATFMPSQSSCEEGGSSGACEGRQRVPGDKRQLQHQVFTSQVCCIFAR